MKPAPIRRLLNVALPGVAAAGIACVAAGHETEYDVAYVETPPEGVELMLDVAGVGPGDYVIDLGTGDGRIAIAAARRGARALGVDLDPELVRKARQQAAAAGVAEQVEIVEQDLFETALGEATVVAMFLNEEVNLRLRPLLFEQLSPGTRVVSHNFDMGDWRPDGHRPFIDERSGSYFIHDVFLWIMPADAAGAWSGQAGGKPLSMQLAQEFQLLDASITLAGRPLLVHGARLAGNRVLIDAEDPESAANYSFEGQVASGAISGTLTQAAFTGTVEVDWRVESGTAIGQTGPASTGR